MPVTSRFLGIVIATYWIDVDTTVPNGMIGRVHGPRREILTPPRL